MGGSAGGRIEGGSEGGSEGGREGGREGEREGAWVVGNAKSKGLKVKIRHPLALSIIDCRDNDMIVHLVIGTHNLNPEQAQFTGMIMHDITLLPRQRGKTAYVLV